MGASNGKTRSKHSANAVHEVRLAATEIVRVAGMGGYHTSIIVDDREYFFDSVGIMEAQPLWSHMLGETKTGDAVSNKTEVTVIGHTHINGRQMAQVLRPFFEKGSYDIFYKNCNTFSDAALYYLTKTRLPGAHNRIERFVINTQPVSVSLLNRLFRALVDHTAETENTEYNTYENPSDIYVTNPEAQDFTVDEVIEILDAEESDQSEAGASDTESESGSETHGCTFRSNLCQARTEKVSKANKC
eukprot:TRINITY_DN23151_c0_g3_i1.p1 TRINITY_DN23151_c0_g3~~TRINITY_DN23151_c0_g3_i1.p1  ORF type:complete len:245 (-),score=29.84 TRINITY_DN23151_c0_g3_i1:195-929(-)